MKIKDKEILKSLEKLRYTEKCFIDDCKAYIKAIKDSRMICSIDSVSASGMSRNLKFISCEKVKGQKYYYYRRYSMLFILFGYKKLKESSYFRIYGSGMNMVFATNYDIVRQIKKLGFIDDKTCEILSQQTPTVI